MTSTEIAVADATAPQPPAASPVGLAEPGPVKLNPVEAVANPIEVEPNPVEASANPVDVKPDPAEPPQPQKTTRLRRIIGMSIWGAVFLVAWLTIGIPTDPVEAFLWIWAATIAWNNEKPWRTHFLFIRDWAVVIALLVIYNISRGWASTVTPHVTSMINADTWMFGWMTGGKTPTVWLQAHLYDYHHVQWFEIVASSVYFSHFLMALIVAAVLWMRNRDRWLSFVRRWFTLTALILTTYFLYPAAPPWWAAQNGYIHDVVDRLSTRGWDAIGLHHAGSLLNAAQVQEANPVAAMPSMHSAYALMIVVFFLPSVRKRWWPLLLCYPLAMTFALVYSGEHYVIDVFMGWAYVAITFAVVWAGERLWAARKSRRTPVEPEVLEPDADGATVDGASLAANESAANDSEATESEANEPEAIPATHGTVMAQRNADMADATDRAS